MVRVGEVHLQVRGKCQVGMAGHLGSLILWPGNRAPGLAGH